MEGITTAIVGFIFVCIVFPHLVKNRTQFYAAFAAIILLLVFAVLAGMVGYDNKFRGFAGVVMGVLQLIALVLIVMSTGGLSLGELTGEFKDAFEVIRRGETEKEIIIPLTGQTPKPRQPAGAARADDDERVVHTLDPDAVEIPRKPVAPVTPVTPDRRADEAGSIPLE